MLSQFSRRIAFNASSVRRLSNQCNKDIKYDMIISDLTQIKNNVFITMSFVVPVAGYCIGTGIGTFMANMLK